MTIAGSTDIAKRQAVEPPAPQATQGGSASAPLPMPTNWRALIRRMMILLIVMSPSVFAIAYYGVFASDRYVSEASFVVRSSTRNVIGGLTSLLRLVGISSAQDDTFAVHDFMASRDAVTGLESRIDIRKSYGSEDADRLARYPSLLFGASKDEFHRYLKNRISVSLNSNTGISTLRVQAFSPAEAQKIARTLLELSEQVVNQINIRIQEDAVRFSMTEVKLLEDKLKSIQLRITQFRNTELQIDPNRSAVLVMELVAKLSDEVSRVSAQIAEVAAASPSSPQLATLERRNDALRAQIARERQRISNSSEGLASKIAQFEELNLEREIAVKALASAVVSLENARTEARRQQLYLERIAGPSLPEKALMPERIFETLSIIMVNLVILLVGWLVRTGIAEHAPSLSKDQR